MTQASPRKRLWLGSAGIALFIATILAAEALIGQRSSSGGPVGLDFIAFYTAGTFVREGKTEQLYDLPATQEFQHDLARRQGVDIGGAYGPWWNPPFYALLFVPLSRLSYPAALNVWVVLNLLCAAASCVLLCRLLPSRTPWRSRLLVPVLLVLSTPFIFAISHGQNTCTSLLLLVITVAFWRAARQRVFAVAAGLTGGLLFYKPQLALVLGIVMAIDLGWGAIAGYAITGFSLLLINLVRLPGTLIDYLHRLPGNLHFVQSQSVYLWGRHVTFKAFWRLLVQGGTRGETLGAVTVLSALSSLIIAAMLLRTIVKSRRSIACAVAPGEVALRRNRLIAATVAATPLLMPFYFDYDLLLLAVPAVLFAVEFIERGSTPLPAADRWLMVAWPVFYLWLMLNPDVAEKTTLNFSVPLLSVVASLLIARVSRIETVVAGAERLDAVPLAQAA